MQTTMVNDLNVKQIRLSDHGHKNAIDRFQLQQKDLKSVLNYCRKRLANAEFIAQTTSEDDNEALLYAYDNFAFYLSLDKATIITCAVYEKARYSPLKKKMIELHKKEIRKLTRTEAACLNKLKKRRLKHNIEIAVAMDRIENTRSKNVVIQCKANIAKCKEDENSLLNTIKNIKAEKRQLAKSLVSLGIAK